MRSWYAACARLGCVAYPLKVFEMPYIVPQGSPTNADLNQTWDGFDPLLPYQMVPLGGTRELYLHTGNFPVDVRLTKPGVAQLTNVNIVSNLQPLPPPIPGYIILPAKSVIKFTLVGQGVGRTGIEVRERPPQAQPLKPCLQLIVSVQPLLRREFGVCYVFDRVNQDHGSRRDFPGHFIEINRLYERQANVNIINADGPDSGTKRARKITLNGSMGKTFDIDDKALLFRLLDTFDAKFPGVRQSVHCQGFSIPVPLRHSSSPTDHVLGVNLRGRHSGKPFNILLVGPQANPSKPTMGGPRPSLTEKLRHTMAHEIGHSMDLDHDPLDVNGIPFDSTLFDLINIFNDGWFTQPKLFNLMYPFYGFNHSSRLNAAQIEKLHL